MKLNEVMMRTGLKHSTIRVYEERGLVTPDTRERNGRVYISLNLYRVRFTKAANVGYEAANFIEDQEHLYGPEENDNGLLPPGDQE